MAYRATRTEPRVAVGTFTGDFEKGTVYQLEPRRFFTSDVAEYLVDQGLLIPCGDKEIDNPWFDSDDPELAAQGNAPKSK